MLRIDENATPVQSWNNPLAHVAQVDDPQSAILIKLGVHEYQQVVVGIDRKHSVPDL
nr:hypothetical protein [Rubellimicrobium roseum]